MKRVLVLCLLLAQACATLPSREYPETILLKVDNGQLGDAALYINGGRIAWVSSLSSDTIAIPLWRLAASGCVSIFVRILAGGTMRTTNECPQRGEYLSLVISPLLSASTLTPFRVGQ